MIMVDEYDVQIVQPTSEWHSKNDAEMMVQHKNSFHKVKRFLRNTTWPFWGVYVIVTDFLTKHETGVIVQPPYSPDSFFSQF